MADRIQTLDQWEWDSAKHRVENGVAVLNSAFYDNTGQRGGQIRDQNRPGMKDGTVSLQVQAAGSGTAGTAPVTLGPLLLACGMAVTNVPATSDTYAVAAALANTPLDIDQYKGNALLYSANNTVGNLQMEYLPGEPCQCVFDGNGTYTEPTDAAGSAAISGDALPPTAIALTSTIAGTQFPLQRALLNLNTENTGPDGDIGGTNAIQDPQLTDGWPSIEMTFREPLVATKNFWNLLTTETKMALNLVLGSVAGNIITTTGDFYFSETIGQGVNKNTHEITIIAKMSWLAGDSQLSIAIT